MRQRQAQLGFPCSKVCDQAGDVETLVPYIATITRCPDALAGQHGIRLWEYAMALRTITRWDAVTRPAPVQGTSYEITPLKICDVGGAGSNFWQVLTGVTSADIQLVDPSCPREATELGQRQMFCGGVEEYAATASHDQFDILTCISVIEHVKDISPFLRAIRMLLKPGGLLFLTTDYWDAEGEDTAHFHWMRERIYNEDTIKRLLIRARELGFASFGVADWTYHGPQVYDYSVASLAVVKK